MKLICTLVVWRNTRTLLRMTPTSNHYRITLNCSSKSQKVELRTVAYYVTLSGGLLHVLELKLIIESIVSALSWVSTVIDVESVQV